jgi:hypothetical protein
MTVLSHRGTNADGRRLFTLFGACLLLFASAAGARAQGETGTGAQASPRQTPTPAVEDRDASAGPAQRPSNASPAELDLSITARVTARELRFEKVPNAKVEFTGKPARTTVWESERQNLPEEVRPGVTYRDIGITLRITSVFSDIERIVAEALGEIPIREEAATPAAQQPAPAATPRVTPPSSSPANSPAAEAAAPAPQTRERRRPSRRGTRR